MPKFFLEGTVSVKYIHDVLVNGGGVDLRPLNKVDVIFYPLVRVNMMTFSGTVGNRGATLEVAVYPDTSILTINSR